ncbi:MAG: hypothetical protein RR324_05820 [Cellulosilyticaceae bacterium]|uniref:hypothetical protein n=1 Tax=Niameybacter sp. TaxID=2033640 RepID=UPI002FCAE49C
MTDEIKQIEQKIKVQKAILQTLIIQFKNSPYNKQPQNIERKKELILDKIKKLEQTRNEKLAL